jgi:hypothetical protein
LIQNCFEKLFLKPLVEPFLQLPLLERKFIEAIWYSRKKERRSPEQANAENEKGEYHMVWIYSLTTIVLAIPGTIVSILVLIEHGREKKENHANK